MDRSHYNTWSHPGQPDFPSGDNQYPSLPIGENNSTSSNSPFNSLDEASSLNTVYRRDSRSDNIEERIEEGETSDNENILQDTTLKKGDDLHGISEIGPRNKNVGDLSVSNTEVTQQLDVAEKDSNILVGGASNLQLTLHRPKSTTNPGTISRENKKTKRFQSMGSSVYQVDRENGVFLLHSSDRPKYVTELSIAFNNNNIKWCEYERDFNPSHSILYDLSVFLFSCKKTVAVLSPGFYQSALFKYFLETTVKYCVDHGKNALIPILVDTKPSDLPIYLNNFEYFTSDHHNYTEQLVKALAEKVQPLKCKGNTLCLDPFSTISSIQSEPSHLKPILSESTKKEMKIWLKKKFVQLPQEFQNQRSDENDEITEEVEVERGVNSEIMFANRLRQEKKKIYDSSITLLEKGFDVTVGDVLEICETCEDGQHVKVRNSRGQTTIMPKQNVLPNVFILPKAAVDVFKYSASKIENNEFETELRFIGMKVFIAVDSPPLSLRQNFAKNDIFAKIYEQGKFVHVKNCRNEFFHVEKRYLKEK